ncbi:hypothetical protein Kkor_0203 [Kangiella koreensis DSM 16069]|uniref:Uncharacterized protein n=1 Tax=Kangiella koreensis (strain DSM 16069 / JCM 12317 / KCTC 12182 / SW-125) TaxID=523791 RepID=C7R6V8_KANKD|nr:hypothetical protein Kkor_0203 [Kangiella koreensis DSM 16069]
MVNITNNRESYKSRSKNIGNVKSSHKKSEKIYQYREEFKVDCNGYFVWGSDEKL